MLVFPEPLGPTSTVSGANEISTLRSVLKFWNVALVIMGVSLT